MKKILIKLGGSVITDKKESPPQAKISEIQRLSNEIYCAKTQEAQIIIVHGAGCFGHIPAKHYQMTSSDWHENKRQGAIVIRQQMNELNRLVVNSLVAVQLPALGLQPSAMAILNARKLELFPIQIVIRWLECGIVPVLYGDVAIDKATGLNILSGDQIIAFLAQYWKPHQVILGTDVDGVFSDDPKKNLQAKLISEINPQNFSQILQGLSGSQHIDVTGGMAQKVKELIALTQMGCKVQIVNATIHGRLQQAIMEKTCIGTWICTSS